MGDALWSALSGFVIAAAVLFIGWEKRRTNAAWDMAAIAFVAAGIFWLLAYFCGWSID